MAAARTPYKLQRMYGYMMIYVEYMWCLFLIVFVSMLPVISCDAVWIKHYQYLSVSIVSNVRSFVVKICAGFQASMESGNPGRSVT